MVFQRQSQPKNYILALVSRAQQGDQAAFDELYQHYLTPLYRYIYFRVNSTSDAEDLTQTVFLKAWRNLSTFQYQGHPFSAWLYQIARRTLIDYYRQRKETVLSQPIENFAWLMDNQSVTPAEYIDQQQKLGFLRQIIQTLSTEQREVIILKFINDLTTQEIAHRLNKKAAAVRALQYRALKALRTKIKTLDFN